MLLGLVELKEFDIKMYEGNAVKRSVWLWVTMDQGVLRWYGHVGRNLQSVYA